MTSKLSRIFAGVILAGALAFTASAQGGTPQTTAPPAKHPARTPAINKHQQNQRQRIHQGVKSGELTRRETARLREEQRDIRRDERLARSDGKVSAGERKIIRHEQRKASRDIYKQKHDAQKRPKARKG